MAKRWRYLAPLGVACMVVAAIAIADTGGELARDPVRQSAATVGAAHEAWPGLVRWLAFGGGVEPASNQVSIEQDLALVGELLGPGGVTLFAGGAGRSPVQVQRRSERRGRVGGLHRRLGDLFWPQGGRSASYRASKLKAHGDARAETVLATWLDALEQPSLDPLFVFVAAHGDPGKERNGNVVRLWGGVPINVVDLTALLDDVAVARPLRLVMASCFSGGFAETAFVGAEPDVGATSTDRCGLFATTWDTEAAGCDPNPDRRAQESYFVHLLNALKGLDREGQAAALDLDGDGRISLSEAHTRVRIASRSISVPTTTSERWLRWSASRLPGAVPEAQAPAELVEEHAVVAALGELLELRRLTAATEKASALQAEARALEQDLVELQLARDVVGADLRIALLERWPVLDDPYHPNYLAMLASNESAIRSLLDTSPLATLYRRAIAAEQRGGDALDNVDVEISMVRRLLRAFENLMAASALREHDPVAYARFMKFLRCERTLPPLAEPAAAAR